MLQELIEALRNRQVILFAGALEYMLRPAMVRLYQATAGK